jgi:hypothetical protein
MAGERAPGTATATQPFDGAAVESLIVRLPERYQPLRILGRGGQGMVWLAADRELGEQVAIKVLNRLDGVAAERVRREVRVCRRLRHPNLAEIYELVEAGETLAVVMEHLPGGSLTDRVRSGPSAVAEAARIARALLAGLAHLHGAGVVHRDVKPSNVLFTADGAPKLADFGLLRPCEADDGLTRTGLAVGTPSYMSPEQIRGDEPAPASDLYSLGATLFELLSGRRPFTATSALEVAHLHRSARPPGVRTLRADCPRWLAAFVDRLLAKEPRHRWRDAGAALAAFDRRRPGLRRGTRRRLAAGALAAAALGGAAVAVRVALDDPVAAARVEGREVIALARDGGELWRRALDPPPSLAVAADVLPGPGVEVVAASRREAGAGTGATLAVLGTGGAELQRIPISDPPEAASPGLTPMFALERLAAGDLDGDGADEPIWALLHRTSYPAVVGWWSHRDPGATGHRFYNSGHVLEARTADVDGDGANELLLLVINNPLGYQNALAVIEPRDYRLPESGAVIASPDTMAAAEESASWGDLRSYTPLGERVSPVTITSAGRGGIVVTAAGAALRLDGDGNPAGAPLHGRGVEARQRFWRDRMTASLRLAGSPDDAPALVEAFCLSHADAWSEPPMRDAALLLFADDLAGAGRPELGAAVLALAERGEATNRRALRRRGELLLLAGERHAAAALLTRAVTSVGRGAQPVDALRLLLLDAAAHGDAAALAQADRLHHGVTGGAPSEQFRQTGALAALLAGRWQDVGGAAAPDNGDAALQFVIAQWAALESGTAPAAVLARLEPLAPWIEARGARLTVEARAHALAGDAAAAALRAEAALAELRGRGRRSYEAFLWEGVAHWALGAALAAGDPAAARPHLELAAGRLPGTWLGRDAAARLGRRTGRLHSPA